MNNNSSYATPGSWPASNDDRRTQAQYQSGVALPPIISPGHPSGHAGQHSQSFAFQLGQQGNLPYPQYAGEGAGSQRTESGRSDSWLGWFWSLIGPRPSTENVNAYPAGAYAGGNAPNNGRTYSMPAQGTANQGGWQQFNQTYNAAAAPNGAQSGPALSGQYGNVPTDPSMALLQQQLAAFQLNPNAGNSSKANRPGPPTTTSTHGLPHNSGATQGQHQAQQLNVNPNSSQPGNQNPAAQANIAETIAYLQRMNSLNSSVSPLSTNGTPSPFPLNMQPQLGPQQPHSQQQGASHHGNGQQGSGQPPQPVQYANNGQQQGTQSTGSGIQLPRTQQHQVLGQQPGVSQPNSQGQQQGNAQPNSNGQQFNGQLPWQSQQSLGQHQSGQHQSGQQQAGQQQAGQQQAGQQQQRQRQAGQQQPGQQQAGQQQGSQPAGSGIQFPTTQQHQVLGQQPGVGQPQIQLQQQSNAQPNSNGQPQLNGQMHWQGQQAGQQQQRQQPGQQQPGQQQPGQQQPGQQQQRQQQMVLPPQGAGAQPGNPQHQIVGQTQWNGQQLPWNAQQSGVSQINGQNPPMPQIPPNPAQQGTPAANITSQQQSSQSRGPNQSTPRGPLAPNGNMPQPLPVPSIERDQASAAGRAPLPNGSFPQGDPRNFAGQQNNLNGAHNPAGGVYNAQGQSNVPPQGNHFGGPQAIPQPQVPLNPATNPVPPNPYVQVEVNQQLQSPTLLPFNIPQYPAPLIPWAARSDELYKLALIDIAERIHSWTQCFEGDPLKEFTPQNVIIIRGCLDTFQFIEPGLVTALDTEQLSLEGMYYTSAHRRLLAEHLIALNLQNSVFMPFFVGLDIEAGKSLVSITDALYRDPRTANLDLQWRQAVCRHLATRVSRTQPTAQIIARIMPVLQALYPIALPVQWGGLMTIIQELVDVVREMKAEMNVYASVFLTKGSLGNSDYRTRSAGSNEWGPVFLCAFPGVRKRWWDEPRQGWYERMLTPAVVALNSVVTSD